MRIKPETFYIDIYFLYHDLTSRVASQKLRISSHESSYESKTMDTRARNMAGFIFDNKTEIIAMFMG